MDVRVRLAEADLRVESVQPGQAVHDPAGNGLPTAAEGLAADLVVMGANVPDVRDSPACGHAMSTGMNSAPSARRTVTRCGKRQASATSRSAAL